MVLAQAEGYSLARERADGEVWAVGRCPEDHPFRMRLGNLRKGQRCGSCRRNSQVQPHLAKATTEGYRLHAELRAAGKRAFTWLVGVCPRGHEFAMQIGNFGKGHRCGPCQSAQVHERHVTSAIEQGFTGARIELRPNATQNIAWLVATCPNGHPFAMRTSNFLKGQRCAACVDEERLRALLDEAQQEGYLLLPESRLAGERLYLAGKCPVGHRVRMLASNFKDGRRRCQGCATHGYRTSLPGIFYVLSAPNGVAGTADRRPILKFGICNPGSGRMEAHQRSGFAIPPRLALQCEDGAAILAMEQRIKRELNKRGISTCHAQGIRFDGSTESIVETVRDRAILDDLVADYVALSEGAVWHTTLVVARDANRRARLVPSLGAARTPTETAIAS